MEPPPLRSAELSVHLRPSGCVDMAVAVGSFGMVPVYLYFYRRKMPGRLTEEAMILRDGTVVPWGRFKRTKRTDIYYGPREVFTGSRYQLWYEGGKVQFGTPMLANADPVVAFIFSHLPAEARGET